MFLKSLTLRGFKSFADKTILDFETGVTVVVGPNGSGKSNVVDAVAWVLGAQGARALRGGKMDDVIFAGTADRPALGRAEVSLTIDNANRLLPIEFSEVTITRTLFRTGESEYQMNGESCRLLDIQELLSDTGIGRQQHVIVGQGQLDAVLNARPEDRRGVIEEAAGILKFRRRKEKAERRLDATEANLLRLTDLLREVRRQLRPLERQADAARRHDGLVADLRAVRLHLSGREIEALQSRLQRRKGSRAELAEVESGVRGRLRDLDTAVIEAERALSLPGDDDVADLLSRAESLRERARGLQALVTERLRGLDRELEAVADEGVVESLVADAAALREEIAAVDVESLGLVPLRADAEAAERAATAAREDLLGDSGPQGGIETRERRAADDAARELEDAWREAESEARAHEARAEALAADLPAARAGLASVEAALAELQPEREVAEGAEQALARVRAALDDDARSGSAEQPAQVSVDLAEAAVRTADEAWRAAEGEASRWRARAEALALALAEAQASAGGECLSGMSGVVGPLLDGLQIDDGMEAAVAAALGDAMHAVVIDGSAAARAAVERVKEGDAQAMLVVADSAEGGRVQGVLLPPGVRPLFECVRSTSPALDAALRQLLANVALVETGWRAALDLALGDPAVVVVTPEGDRFGGATPWRAGPPGRSAVTSASLAEAVEEAERSEVALPMPRRRSPRRVPASTTLGERCGSTRRPSARGAQRSIANWSMREVAGTRSRCVQRRSRSVGRAWCDASAASRRASPAHPSAAQRSTRGARRRASLSMVRG
ncbi:MAG: AAA family ATPase [Acidimicrobiia bacterium]|nr:AAA family ATPase [Acidimicrobiia bacterium]